MNTAKRFEHDCVYYWDGGSELGRWRRAVPRRPLNAPPEAKTPTLSELERSIRRQGYFTVRGSVAVGAPEGKPRRKAWDAFQADVRAGRVSL